MNILSNVIGVKEAAVITGLAEGTIKNYCALGTIESKKIGRTWVIDKQKLEEWEMSRNMKMWNRGTYTVEMIDYDMDLKGFEIVQGDNIQTIYPATLEDMEVIIADLDAGEDVNGWEDGMGNTINID